MNHNLPQKALVICLLAGTFCAGQEVNMLTSNTIYDVTGSGDTMWLQTSAGVNYAILPDSGVPQWHGYEHMETWGLFFAAETSIATLSLPTLDTICSFWLYDHKTHAPINKTINWRFSDGPNPDTFICYDVKKTAGTWWLACYDGGLVSWSFAQDAGRVYFPGVAGSFDVSTFPVRSDSALMPRLQSRSKRIMGLAVLGTEPDTVHIAAMASKEVWIFSPADSLWDSLPSVFSPSIASYEFIDIHANSSVVPATLYATVSDTVDTALYKFDFTLRQWKRFYGAGSRTSPHKAQSVAFGKNGTVYVADETEIFAYHDTAGTGHLPFDSPIAGLGTTHFSSRILKATDEMLTGITISAITATTSPADTLLRFFVATNQGLFYTRNETADEAEETVFSFVKRSPPVKSALKESYAFPGILVWRGTDRPTTTFAYNLSKDAKVTIKVYDWNMDLVKTVIDRQQRRTGTTRQSGRSTEQATDLWDGTNQNGVIVAPGVYYYVISTDTGERSRGKIVVALSR